MEIFKFFLQWHRIEQRKMWNCLMKSGKKQKACFFVEQENYFFDYYRLNLPIGYNAINKYKKILFLICHPIRLYTISFLMRLSFKSWCRQFLFSSANEKCAGFMISSTFGTSHSLLRCEENILLKERLHLKRNGYLSDLSLKNL